MTYDLFAVCAPGLEPITELELKKLGLTSFSSLHEKGGVEFRGVQRDIYRANLHLRTASRILVRMGSFSATLFPELRRKAGRMRWEEFLIPGQPVSFRVTCHASRLYHENGVAERMVGAIADRLGRTPPVKTLSEDRLHSTPGERDRVREDITANIGQSSDDGNPAQLIFVRLNENHCTISADSSGPLLHRRGYRLATAKAPLRETLAAGMLIASGWKPEFPLIDPFCGSGTIPIEAALLAARIPPGLKRKFAFMNWPSFDGQMWSMILKEAPDTLRASAPLLIGSDRDAGAIAAAWANAERAGVIGRIEFSHRAISAIEPLPGPGWVVTNPPYGLRVSTTRDLRDLYAQTGNVLRAKFQGWKIAMLCNSTQLLQRTGLKFEKTINLMNGGVAVQLAMGEIG